MNVDVWVDPTGWLLIRTEKDGEPLGILPPALLLKREDFGGRGCCE